MSGIEVRDSGDLRKYRTEVPNLVFEMGLSPYALALYMHFRRTAGDDGRCWKSTRTLASGTGISAGTISKARKELEGRDLIGVQYPENNNKSIVVTITDIWPENFQHFAGQTPKPKTPAKTRSRRDTPVQETNAPVQETNATCSPGERRKEPTEEGTIEEVPVGADKPPQDDSQDKENVNYMTVFCEASKVLGYKLAPEDRRDLPKNLKTVAAEGHDDTFMRKVVRRCLTARDDRQHPLSPQRARDELLGNVTPINQRKQSENRDIPEEAYDREAY